MTLVFSSDVPFAPSVPVLLSSTFSAIRQCLTAILIRFVSPSFVVSLLPRICQVFTNFPQLALMDQRCSCLMLEQYCCGNGGKGIYIHFIEGEFFITTVPKTIYSLFLLFPTLYILSLCCSRLYIFFIPAVPSSIYCLSLLFPALYNLYPCCS